MPSVERDSSRDSIRQLRHQPSVSSDHGKAMVPMWDSSDPDRAPPPLPLNPASSPSVTSRPNTSTAIQSAHAALTEKARENSFIQNHSPERKRNDQSPDRSLIKGAAHKRMQSLQTGHVRDLSTFLESGNLSPPKSPEKASSRPASPMFEMKDRDMPSSSTPTPNQSGRDTPTLRPSLRRPPQSILGENTPPQSATMLALQSMAAKSVDAPLADVTNGSTALIRTPQTFDAISNQILSLTSIATSLQREMAQLSRRSKDNATDLVSLKEATNSRDEDIRKSLRELVVNLNDPQSRFASSFATSNFLLDNKPHTPNQRGIKTVSLPRIPSPNSFSASMDRESMMSPTPYHGDGSASIALLEKVLRDMGTKEGQDLLVARLSAVSERLAQDGIATARKLEDLVQFIKDNSENQALVPRTDAGNGVIGSRDFAYTEAPHLELDFDTPSSGSMLARVENLLGHSSNKENRGASEKSKSADILTEDILKVVRTVKDSVAQTGGLTAEVKALVQNLRGEVLGMGRKIGKQLEETTRSSDAGSDSNGGDRVTRVVQDGLSQLQTQMTEIVREARRQSNGSTMSRNTFDGQEIYNAVRSALADQPPSNNIESGLVKDDVVEAVREAWENYKPDIELQHFGLEREELLTCLKEGIKEYMPQEGAYNAIGATRDEVFTAVVEGLKHFTPPKAEVESLSREEIVETVRECLEEFEFPVASSAVSTGMDITRDDMVEAVREGLNSFEFPTITQTQNRDTDNGLDRKEVFDIIKESFQSMPRARFEYGQEINDRLEEIIETVRTEFQAVSDEAKQNVAASGRDTEQVLDATKDGMEKLRADIETYVDRAADITGKDEILDAIREGFDSLRDELESLMQHDTSASIDGIKEEVERFRDTMSTAIVPGSHASDKEEILAAIQDGLQNIRLDGSQNKDSGESILSGTGEILDALHDGLTQLRADVDKISNKPFDMTVNYEILDTLKSGLEGVRSELDKLHENRSADREIAPIGSGAIIAAEGLNRNDIAHLEVLITQLQIKVEAMESLPVPAPASVAESLSRNDLAIVEEAMKNIQASVGEISSDKRSEGEDAVRKEDVEAIETLLRNTKAKLDEFEPEQSVKKEHLDTVELIVRETRDGVNDLLSQITETSRREDLAELESLVKDVVLAMAEAKDRALSTSRDSTNTKMIEVEAIESLGAEIRERIDQFVDGDLATLAAKSDVEGLGQAVKELRTELQTQADSYAQASEDRQAEIVGVGTEVTELKTSLEDVRDRLGEKLDQGSNSTEALGKVISGLEDHMGETSTGLKEVVEVLKAEFEKSNAGVVGVKLESDEQFQKTWTKFDEKFDELMTKYDDAQLAADAKVTDGDEKMAASEKAILSTNTIAQELKLLIDTLGTTMTESVDKMDEASRTVFNKVDETFHRIEETHAAGQTEHQLTREHVHKTLTGIEGVQAQVTDYHPKIMESLKDVLQIVGQHYEHSKITADTLQEKIAERPTSSSSDVGMQLLKDVPVAEKYDDAPVHEKLDKLVDGMYIADQTSAQSSAQLEMLDKIHAQVLETAAEVSSLISSQAQRLTNDHDVKEQQAEAAATALERRLAQKEALDAEMNSLRADADQMKERASALKDENDQLMQQKMKLSADVSSLETALRLRKEELQAMEARAEGLERRILEGVIDHSRVFLLNKNQVGGRAGRDAMNLKRVPSHGSSIRGSNLSYTTPRSGPKYSAQKAVDMAMVGNRSMAPTTNNVANLSAGAARRILSLNQITHNLPNGGFKRSHSVKAIGGASGPRKTSWGGDLKSGGYGELNKENLALQEDEEDDEDFDDAVSDAGTMRRVSRGTMGMTESTIDEGSEWTESEVGGSDLSERGHVVLYDEAA